MHIPQRPTVPLALTVFVTAIIGVIGVPARTSGASSPTHAESWRESYLAGEPMRFGNRVQLLFDDYAVEDTFALRRVMGPIEKHAANPFDLKPTMAWHRSWHTPIIDYGFRRVIFDPFAKVFRAWARTTFWSKPGGQGKRMLATAYAESRDGLNWVQPELENHMLNGHRTNLVLFKPDAAMDLIHVRLDAEASDPSRRYVGWVRTSLPGESGRVMAEMFSPDGKNWTFAPAPKMWEHADDGSHSLVRDADRNRWLLYTRPSAVAHARGIGFYQGVSPSRRVSVRMSSGLREWTYPRMISVLDEADEPEVAMLGNQRDIDSVEVVRYGDFFLGFIGLMDNLGNHPQQTYFMWSRDGLRWERMAWRTPVIPTGQPGEWDAGEAGRPSILPDPFNPDRILIYYRGNGVSQKEERLPRMLGFGLATLGRDRWIGWQAGIDSGLLLTRQFVLEGDRLEINCRSQVARPPSAQYGSVIRVELLQPWEANPSSERPLPYPGFGLDDCDPIDVTDDFARVVTWKGSSDLSSLRGKQVFVRFHLRSATLYSFRIGDSTALSGK